LLDPGGRRVARQGITGRRERLDATRIDIDLSAVRTSGGGADADRRLPVLLCLQRLWREAQASRGRLLRILLVRVSALSADAGVREIRLQVKLKHARRGLPVTIHGLRCRPPISFLFERVGIADFNPRVTLKKLPYPPRASLAVPVGSMIINSSTSTRDPPADVACTPLHDLIRPRPTSSRPPASMQRADGPRAAGAPLQQPSRFTLAPGDEFC